MAPAQMDPARIAAARITTAYSHPTTFSLPRSRPPSDAKLETSRPYWRVALLAVSLWLACTGSTWAQQSEGPRGDRSARPNIVLLIADDLGKELGCYDYEVARTPNIDAVATQGTRFNRAFATTASCSASRSVILTGLHNHANGQYGHTHAYHHFRAYDNLMTLPVGLELLGYRTARIGKMHVEPEATTFRFQKVIPGNPRSPVEMARACREWMATTGDEPFFLYYCTADPHRGGGFDESDPQRPDRFGNRPQGYPGVTPEVFSPGEVTVPDFLPDTAACRSELAQYLQSVSRFDAGVGEMMTILDELGIADNTLVIVTSDHGIAFPGGKTTCYEPGLGVPFVVRWPDRVPAGATCDVPISHVDLTPSLLDFAARTFNEPVPSEIDLSKMHGRSRVDLWQGTAEPADTTVYASHTFHEITMYYPMRVVREERYKLIWNIAHQLPYPFASDLYEAATWQDALRRGPEFIYGRRSVDAYVHRPEFELYDLEADPAEGDNLADNPEYAAELERLKRKLQQFQRDTQDPWELKWRYE